MTNACHPSTRSPKKFCGQGDRRDQSKLSFYQLQSLGDAMLLDYNNVKPILDMT